MEFLRLIEDNLRAISAESSKKYPEVAQASIVALQELKSTREAYVRSVRGDGVEGSSAKFIASSDFASPYILLCNYSDCSNKLVQMSLNGLQQQLKHELIPAKDLQNILRVLHIQSLIPTKQDCYLKILQVLVQIANQITHDNECLVYVNEHIIGTLLVVSLTLADSKNPASITSAAFGTARQITGLVIDKSSLYLTEASNKSDVLPEVLEQLKSCFVFIFREFSWFLEGLPSPAIKIAHIPQQFALDVVCELIAQGQPIVQGDSEIKDLVLRTCMKTLRKLLVNIQVDHVMLSLRSGVAAAATYCSKVARLCRTLLIDFEVESWDYVDSLVELIFVAMQPCTVDQIPNLTKQKSGDDGKVEESSMFSKLLPLSVAASQLISKASQAHHQLSNVPTAVRHLFASEPESFLIVQRGSDHGSSEHLRFYASHPCACCLELAMTALSKLLPKLLASEAGWSVAFNIATKLLISSGDLINCLVNDEKCWRFVFFSFFFYTVFIIFVRVFRLIQQSVYSSSLAGIWKQSTAISDSAAEIDPFIGVFNTISASNGTRFSDALVISIMAQRVNGRRIVNTAMSSELMCWY